MLENGGEASAAPTRRLGLGLGLGLGLALALALWLGLWLGLGLDLGEPGAPIREANLFLRLTAKEAEAATGVRPGE